MMFDRVLFTLRINKHANQFFVRFEIIMVKPQWFKMGRAHLYFTSNTCHPFKPVIHGVKSVSSLFKEGTEAWTFPSLLRKVEGLFRKEAIT